jgi:hypothetical protein
MLTTSGTYPWSFVTDILYGGNRKTFELMTSTLPIRTDAERSEGHMISSSNLSFQIKCLVRQNKYIMVYIFVLMFSIFC